MPREFSLFDALVPTMFIVFLASVVLQVVVDRLLGRCSLYRHVWHPPMFRVAIFVCIFGLLGLVALR